MSGAIPLLPLWTFVAYFGVNVFSSDCQKKPKFFREFEFRLFYDVLNIVISFSIRFLTA